MSNSQQYQDRVIDVARRAHEMRSALLTPVIDGNTGEFIGDKKARQEKLAGAASGTVYEGCSSKEGGNLVLETHSKSLQRYCSAHGMPSDELLASAHKSIENTLLLTSGDAKVAQGSIFESAEMSGTEGVLMRDRMVALILPVQLQSITSRMVTHIPGDFNQSEMFKIWRVAGSTFGDLAKGDKIDYNYNARYTCMDQRWQAPDGTGTATGSSDEFRLVTSSAYGTKYPLKRKSVKVMHARDIVAADDGNGNLYGSFTNAAGDTVSVTGTVDYTNGTVNPVFTVAPVAETEIHIGFDVDIEKDPSLIPRVDHVMESRLLYPHEAAISANTTLQALWALRREYNLNADNMAMQAMRNLLSTDQDRKVLRDLYFFANGSADWEYTVPSGLTNREHYESLKQTLLDIDSTLINRNGISGLVGIVADPKAAAVFRYLPAPYFEAAPGYRKMAQPHYVGRVFGLWDLYEDPAADSYTALCFGKGANHGESGYVVGSAIPALSFKHPTLTDLVYRSTLWELGYRDLNPFDGRDYFMKLTMSAGA
jgi:hypothetical protein